MVSDPVELFFNFAAFCVFCIYLPYKVVRGIWHTITGKKRGDDK